VAAADPRSYDLPDFRTLGDGPYPPILLEAFERPGVRGGDEEQRQPAHADHPGLPHRDPGGAPATGTGRGFVFTGKEGGLLRRSNFRRRYWKPALDRAGLDTALSLTI
jgi:hypothetical protein